MPVDWQSIVQQLPRATPREAAVSVGQVLAALRDSFRAGDERDLFLTLVSEKLYGLRCGPAARPTWVHFSHLQVGERFVDPQGRLMQKVAPQEQHSADGSFAPPFVAVDLQTGEPVFLRANARVERVDAPSDLT